MTDSHTLHLGIDTGGTFTDFVLFDGRTLKVHKVLSTPAAPEEAILQGSGELSGTPDSIRRTRVVHGSTVATNAALEGKGVRTAYITCYGLGDLLTIGRQARRELYNLQPEPVTPPVPVELCLETGGRCDPDGEVIDPLPFEELTRLRGELERLNPRAVAINLLFSYVEDHWERTIESMIPEGIFVSRASDILAEYGEYERGIATWLNSYVGPLVEGYLRRLEEGLDGAPLAVMQSSGGTIDASQAGKRAVNMLLSGPAGGLMGAQFVGRSAGCERLLTFDMGGTSTDVALIDGEVRLTSEGRIAGYPVAVPMVEMHTIGAGGGSIATVDGGGLLQVGPQSAGAAPGPACYGKGGVEPTVTDANLVLGRLRPDAFLGGRMTLDVEAARAAVARIAEPLGLTIEEAAEGIIRIANEHMARALRVISVERGIDPRGFVLTSFGGAGGLHVCALAEALGMERALVPIHAGVLSALGMLAAPKARRLSRSVTTLIADTAQETVRTYFDEMIIQGEREMLAEGVPAAEVTIERGADLRYHGQSFTLNLPWQGPTATAHAFHQAHEARYGHRLDAPVELVNLRIGLRGPTPELELANIPRNSETTPASEATLYGLDHPVPVHARDTLHADQEIEGPALITETVSTTYLAPGWHCRVDPHGNLLLTKQNR